MNRTKHQVQNHQNSAKKKIHLMFPQTLKQHSIRPFCYKFQSPAPCGTQKPTRKPTTLHVVTVWKRAFGSGDFSCIIAIRLHDCCEGIMMDYELWWIVDSCFFMSSILSYSLHECSWGWGAWIGAKTWLDLLLAHGDSAYLQASSAGFSKRFTPNLQHGKST